MHPQAWRETHRAHFLKKKGERAQEYLEAHPKFAPHARPHCTTKNWVKDIYYWGSARCRGVAASFNGHLIYDSAWHFSNTPRGIETDIFYQHLENSEMPHKLKHLIFLPSKIARWQENDIPRESYCSAELEKLVFSRMTCILPSEEWLKI